MLITSKLREVVLEVGLLDLLLKDVSFVEEEDNSTLLEEWVTQYGPKQCKAFLHPVHLTVLQEYLSTMTSPLP